MLWVCEVSLVVPRDPARAYKPEGYTNTVTKELESTAEDCETFTRELYEWGLAGLVEVDGVIFASKPLYIVVYKKEKAVCLTAV